MSQDQNNISTGTLNGQPKRFLKKGEGLKRFAAYKPPPPTTTTKAQRRQTFVRFKLDGKLKRDQHFIHPDILLDDSINLSTEIPKIAPPKIMHTPVRPNNRLALGTLNSQASQQTISDSQINGNIDNLLKKIEERKSTLEEERRNEAALFKTPDPPRRNKNNKINNNDINNDNYVGGELSGSEKDNNDDNYDDGASDTADSASVSSQQRVAITQPQPPRTQKPKRSQKQPKPAHVDNQVQVSPSFDLSTPTPGNCILALGRQIQQIQDTVNELKDKIKNCECGALAPRPQRRPTTRSQAKASQAKPSSDKTRPSADADNNNPTVNLLNCLNSKIDQLRENFEEMNLKR